MADKDYLEKEYRLIREIPENDLMEIIPAPGQKVPFVEEYLVTYHIPTYAEGGREIQSDITVKANIAGVYPVIDVVEGKVPFNPNWSVSGRFGEGSPFSMTGSLREYLVYVGKTLQYQPNCLDLDSPCNSAASRFVVLHPHLFPTDNRVFPLFPVDSDSATAPAFPESTLITITVLFPWRSGSETIEAPKEMCLLEIMEQLSEAGLIPDGRPDQWIFRDHTSKKCLDMNLSLAENGIKDGDCLRLWGCAYGCPSAEEIPGIVPECMLTKFEGSDDEKL